ncbi:metallopeptidase family protein [Glutamicibacter creatinolyticus]|nr:MULTISPECIES: metallopeptidase family protein [Glutamicibacter]TLK54789.1 metallopeptidase family protein [Glutamicibacter sp. V16R2B1]
MDLQMPDEEFDELVRQAIEAIPASAQRMMDNVAFFIEDEYEPLPGEPENTEILGIYEGIALTERDHDWAAGAMPDRIIIFKNPTLRVCRSPEEVVREVGITVMHELAHHFGIDDARLHELGWG